jgi:hypothetical protein
MKQAGADPMATCSSPGITGVPFTVDCSRCISDGIRVFILRDAVGDEVHAICRREIFVLLELLISSLAMFSFRFCPLSVIARASLPRNVLWLVPYNYPRQARPTLSRSSRDAEST